MPNSKHCKNLRVRKSVINGNLRSPILTRSQKNKENPNLKKIQTTKLSQNNMAEAKLETILQHLPCFDGKKESNIDFFLKQWETLAKDSKLKPEIKLILLKAKFSGPARETIVNSKALNEEGDYDEFVKKIKTEFQPKANFETVQNSFLSLKQKATQKLDEFIREFDMAATRYVELSGQAQQPGTIEFLNKIKLTRFIEAIRSDIALEVRKITPETYEEATSIALKTEAAFNAIPQESLNNINHTNQINMLETFENMTKNYKDEIQKLRQEILEMKINKPENIAQKTKCEICDKTNHMTKDCFKNPKNKNSKKSGEQNKKYNITRYPHYQSQNVMTHPPYNPCTPPMNSYQNWGPTNNWGNPMDPRNFGQFHPSMNYQNCPQTQNQTGQNFMQSRQNYGGQKGYGKNNNQYNQGYGKKNNNKFQKKSLN